MIVTIYWIYRGLRRGLYPALNMFLVFFVPLLITVNYYDVLFNVVAKISPESTNTVREMIAFIATYFLSFGICVYLCIWLCVDVMRIHKLVDLVGGALCGAACGIVCSGVMVMMWFTVPIAQEKFPIDDAQLFFPTTRFTLQAATFVAGRIPAERPFIGERFLRDLRFGLPQIPGVGAGFYASSVPTGLRVFIDSSGLSPMQFLDKLKERISKPWEEPTATEAKRPFGEKRRSPVFIEQEAKTALIAVVMDDVPPDIARETDAAKMFVNDGEIYYSREAISDRVLFVKIYRVQRETGVGSVISLFQPADPELADRMMQALIPSRACFRFDAARMRTALMGSGVTSEADALILRLQFCGKVRFEGLAGKTYCAEVLGDGRWNIFEVVAPNLEGVKKEAGSYWTPPR